MSKLIQIADNIHGTIYCSEIERSIMKTPFFNRLHDVNQSSTVYFTFPPNRTKRYEHSLGTMQITSDLFYNAVSNSIGSEANNILFANAKDEFQKIIDYFKKPIDDYPLDIDRNVRDKFSIISKYEFNDICDIISDTFFDSFSNNYLIQYIPRALDNNFTSFLYLSLLESLRIVGLLHDCGHPPQSHIIESILRDIYNEIFDLPIHELTPRQNRFKTIYENFLAIDNNRLSKIDNKMAIKTNKPQIEHLHEMIGTQVCINIFDTIFPECLVHDTDDTYLIKLLYNLTVYEFVFAILRNKTGFWKSLHEIIDGVIDSDRLDFVGRDSKNSGMEWGTVPFKRLVNSVKLCDVSSLTQKHKDIRICFSIKAMDAMDELLRNRYKIFAYINYHHHSTCVATLYQNAVKYMATEYLSNKAPDTNSLPYNDISGLWKSVELAYSPQVTILNFIQWNDSWLNGLLCKEFINLSSPLARLSSEAKTCKFALEEIFLNKKNYISLIKRQTEQREINNSALQILKTYIENLENRKNELHVSATKHINKLETLKSKNAITRIKKIIIDEQYLIEHIEITCNLIQNSDWRELETHLGPFYVDSVEAVLEDEKVIKEAFIIKSVNFSLGLSDPNYVYVYDYKNEVSSYTDNSNIKIDLENTYKSLPPYYIYLLQSGITSDRYDFIKIRKDIGEKIAMTIISKCEDIYL